LTGEEFLHELLGRHDVSWGLGSGAETLENKLIPLVRRWGGQAIAEVIPSGSYAKGTVIRGGTDIDLLISLRDDVAYTVGDLYFNLFQWLGREGFAIRTQNVSIGMQFEEHKVDLIPAKRLGWPGDDCYVYRWRLDTWTKTNIREHVRLVRESGRTEEIKAIKLWRNIHGLEFPSFCLELAVIEALKGRPTGRLERNVWTVLEFLAEEFAEREFVDLANVENVISNDLSEAGRQMIAQEADRSRHMLTWEEVYGTVNLV